MVSQQENKLLIKNCVPLSSFLSIFDLHCFPILRKVEHL